jgi:hypothetical protein
MSRDASSGYAMMRFLQMETMLRLSCVERLPAPAPPCCHHQIQGPVHVMRPGCVSIHALA